MSRIFGLAKNTRTAHGLYRLDRLNPGDAVLVPIELGDVDRALRRANKAAMAYRSQQEPSSRFVIETTHDGVLCRRVK